jgi:predicted permease
MLLLAAGPGIGMQLGVGVPNSAGSIEPGPLVFLAACGIATIITFVFNLLPAVLLSRRSRANADWERNVTGHSRAPLVRRTLVAGQLALTMMLLVGAGLMTRSVLAIDNAPLGFDASNVLKANMLLPFGHFPDSSSRVRGAQQVIDAIATQPGVEAAAIVAPHPFRLAGGMPVVAEGSTAPAANALSAAVFAVAGDYMKVLRLAHIEGRAIGNQDVATTQPVVVISQRLAQQLWPSSPAIGRRLRIGDGDLRTVVGIVGDTRKSLAVTEPRTDVYVPIAQAPRPFLSVLARTSGDPAQSATVVINTVARVSPVLALAEVEPLGAVIERDGQRMRLLAALLVTFAVLALSLAVLGLYSSLSYLVSLRSRELALRVAVGASGRAIARLIITEGVATLVVGLTVGLFASLFLTRVIASQLFGVEQTDVPTFVTIMLILFVTTALAMAVPARRATHVDPAAVLRGD